MVGETGEKLQSFTFSNPFLRIVIVQTGFASEETVCFSPPSVILWRLPLINVRRRIVMEVFREFLESSTIHGLYYVATAKVAPWSTNTILIHMFFFLHLDTVRQDCLDSKCHHRFRRSRLPGEQVGEHVDVLAGDDHHHHPPHRAAQVPHRHRLPTQGIQHSPQL